jgi:hypothetical protein
MRTLLFAASLFALVGLAPAAPAPPDKLSDDDVAKAEKAVKEQLDKANAQGAAEAPIKDEALERVFPKTAFFTVLFRQYPVGRQPPEGFNVSNVYAAGADGKPQLLKDAKGLEAFLKANLPAVKSDDAAKDAARAAVRLAQELHQDGFYTFALQDDSTKVTTEKDVRKASAKTMAMKGGNGEIVAFLTFDDAGKLTKLEEKADLKEGPRPICQATKLLDADPIVRRMAEQDLFIMGRAAKPYMDEQRAKASPELQKAIDRMWQRILEEGR